MSVRVAPPKVGKMGINVGDPVSFVGDLQQFSSDQLVFGKSMDNRAGLAILIQLMEELRGTQLFGSFAAVATVLEQIGFRGGGMVATQIRPDYAVSIDGVAAADTPGTPAAAQLREQFGMTQAEANFALEIATGDGIQAAADRLSISMGTARTHLSRIFQKTETRRQAELVRILISAASKINARDL